MISLPAPLARPTRSAAAVCALALVAAVPAGAQQTFDLPPASPTPTPAPAGPADERAGVAIPPRAAPSPSPSPSPAPVAAPSPTPQVAPLPLPAVRPSASPAPQQRPPAAGATAPATSTGAPSTTADPAATPGAPPSDLPAGLPASPPAADAPVAGSEVETSDPAIPAAAADTALPSWWPLALAGLGALAVFVAGLLWWRRRKPEALRLAAPVAGTPEARDPAAAATPRLDLALEITAASRSLMMFTLEYRLTIANRSERAVCDLNTALQLACARAGAGQAAGTAQALAAVDRIGPHQGRSLTGRLQLPLAAIAPLRQGQTPLFVPLVHVTLEGENLPAQVRTFVIGTPSASGRVHPIPLDVPPGGIAGLIAQIVAVPPASQAA